MHPAFPKGEDYGSALGETQSGRLFPAPINQTDTLKFTKFLLWQGAFQKMELLVIAVTQEKPRHRPSCWTAFHVSLKIKLAPMAWAFKKPAGWIPLLAASQVSATVVECHQLFWFFAVSGAKRRRRVHATAY